MEQDIKRIGVGSDKFPPIKEEIITIPEPVFTFDSEKIFFDSTTRKFDEDNG